MEGNDLGESNRFPRRVRERPSDCARARARDSWYSFRMRRLPLLASVVLAVAAFGCTPSPEQTCEKLDQLAKDDPKGSFKLSHEKCLANMTEMKERDPDAYKCAAKIVKGTKSLDVAFLGIGICDKNKPKKGDDDTEKAKKGDDDEGSSKKKKKSSDDDE